MTSTARIPTSEIASHPPSRDRPRANPPGRHPPAGTPNAPGESSPAGVVLSAQRPRVLVVDDEPDNIEFVERCLARRYAVDTARSAEEALVLIGQHHYEMIISDQRMPGLSGAEFLASTLDAMPDSIRVIITAYADMDAMVQAINEARIDKYLRKPFSPQDLQKAIEDAQRGRRRVNPSPAAPPHAAMVEALSCGIGVIEQGRLRYPNPALAHRLGCATTQAVGPSLSAYLSTESQPVLAKLLAQAETGHSQQAIVQLARADGPSVSADLSVTPLRRGASSELLVCLHELVPQTPSPTQTEQWPRPRLLLVDPNPRMRQALSRALSGQYEIILAASSEQAIQALQEDPAIDCILAEADPPRADGVLLLRHVRDHHPQLSNRFAFVTANPVPSNVAHLEKPFNLNALQELLASLLT